MQAKCPNCYNYFTHSWQDVGKIVTCSECNVELYLYVEDTNVDFFVVEVELNDDY